MGPKVSQAKIFLYFNQI